MVSFYFLFLPKVKTALRVVSITIYSKIAMLNKKLIAYIYNIKDT